MDLSFFGLSSDPFLDDQDTDNATSDKLTEKETGAYIRRSLKAAGATEQIFYASAIRKIYSYANGSRKLTNKICHIALSAARKQNKKEIDGEIITNCIEDFLDTGVTADTVIQEKRRHPRIKTDLEGNYFINTSKARGMLTVTNISESGIQVQLNKQRVFKIGDRIIIAFYLDDDKKTEIREMMIVKCVIGFFAGLAYNALPNTDAYNNYINQRIEDKE